MSPLGLAATRAVYVGDHPVDARAAAASDLRFIGVLTGASSANDFREFAQVRIVPDLRAVVRLLEEKSAEDR